MPIDAATIDWQQLGTLDSAVYRRGVIGAVPAESATRLFWRRSRLELPDILVNQDNRAPTNEFDEIAVVHALERITPLDHPRFWHQLYTACKHGATVHVVGAYYLHVDSFADPTRYRGLSERQFGYLSALGREQLGRDPYEDGEALKLFTGIDFEVTTLRHIVEPEFEGLSDEARIWAIQHRMNVVRRLHVTLTCHKPARR